MTFNLTCVHIFSSIWVAKWPPFGGKKETASSVDHVFSCTLTICNFNYFPFEGWIWVLIAYILWQNNTLMQTNTYHVYASPERKIHFDFFLFI